MIRILLSTRLGEQRWTQADLAWLQCLDIVVGMVFFM